MQKNYMVKKIKLFFDGSKEFPGLKTIPEIKDEEGSVVIATFNRAYTIKDNVKKFAPLTLTYNVFRGSEAPAFFKNWSDNNDNHDVIVVATDATGEEIHRWTLRDCEAYSYTESPYEAATPEAFSFSITLVCTSVPVWREAA